MEEIKIDQLNLSAGTQHRKLNEDTVDNYAGLLSDGVDFPPVEVIRDGTQYILWDGFHRVAAMEKNNIDTVQANVRTGTFRDAMWLSLGANAGHGQPMTDEEVKRKIAIIILDSSWQNKSLRDIGKHVGRSHEWVRKVKEGILNPDAHLKPEIPNNREILPALDPNGIEIPTNLIEVFDARGRLDKLSVKILELIKESSGYYSEKGMDKLNIKDIKHNLNSAKKLVKSAAPYCVCPLCSDLNPDCEPCSGKGWLTKKQYELVIKL